jgi:hypothetical protein
MNGPLSRPVSRFRAARYLAIRFHLVMAIKDITRESVLLAIAECELLSDGSCEGTVAHYGRFANAAGQERLPFYATSGSRLSGNAV